MVQNTIRASEILIAGFGGQGVLSIGQFLAYAGMLEGKEVSWVPSYGAEMRGGTANCLISISDEEIDSPVFEHPHAAIIFNRPSLARFEHKILPGGLLFVNSSLVHDENHREDIQRYNIPASDLAAKLGSAQVVNMVMLGALLEITKVVKVDSIIECLRTVFPESKHYLLPLNQQALESGAQYV